MSVYLPIYLSRMPYAPSGSNRNRRGRRRKRRRRRRRRRRRGRRRRRMLLCNEGLWSVLVKPLI
jgi:hypothetical protein